MCGRRVLLLLFSYFFGCNYWLLG
uniref:Uncharacterized protein n=1 Tax=Rhizophora mucronata TaxID=61149 RepID=A0A2P2Q0F1_RHIMU